MVGAQRVLLTKRLQDFAMKDLQDGFRLETHAGRFPISKGELIAKIADKEGILCMPYDTIDREVIEAAADLRAISTYSVGYEHIDLQCTKSRGILVGYTPDVLTRATADLAFALMLDVMRRVSEGDRLIRSGGWHQVFGPCDFLGTDLETKTVGILGPGRIGLSFAEKAQAFGMKVVYHGNGRLSERQERQAGIEHVSLNQLFSESDIVSLHIPHTKRTHDMVNRSLLAKMKRGAFIVNTSRGRVVNQKDLVLALQNGDLAGAALDVFYDEPLGADSPLAKMENVVLTPHMGSSTKETRENMARLAVLNLKMAMAGRRPKCAV